MKLLSKAIAVSALLMGLWTQTANGQQRSMDEVMRIAAQSPVGNLLSGAKSKSFNGTQANAQPYYVFNAGEGKGFVIVSGDERMAPVLGYSTEGNFDLDSLPDNVQAWLSMYETEYNTLDDKDNAKSGGYAGSIVASTEGVEPFMTSTWGQNAPFNDLCPEYTTGAKSATGCGATAMAQCMYYYRYPAVGTGSHSYTSSTHRFSLSWDFSTHPLEWGLMKNYYATTGNTADEVRTISELLYACGVAVDMDYDEESGSYHGDVMEALYKYYGYDADMAIIQRDRMADEDWHAALRKELEARRPLLVSSKTKSGSGHMFLIHGYQINDGTPSYYMNWGWRGRYDGYFVMPDLCYDGNPANSLSEGISIMIGIQPDNGIEDSENVLLLTAINAAKTNVDISESNRLDINLQGLYNASRKQFYGDVRLYLQDSDGNLTHLYTFSNQTLKRNYNYTLSVKATLPATLESGAYSLVCYAVNSGSGNEVKIRHKTSASLTIINNAADYKAQLAASAIEVRKTGDRSFALDATNVMNVAELDFSGTMQMLVTDYANNNLLTFGESITLSDVGQYSYYPRTDSYTGQLPDAIGDGAYRLHLGARQSGYVNWGKVKKYTIEGGYITNLDIDGSTPFWVLDNVITLEAPTATLTFRIDGEIISQNVVVMGEPITPPEPPAKEGYTFGGWATMPATMPATDLTIEGTYRINKYSVRFVAEGKTVSDRTFDFGSPIVPPEAPAKEGYTFVSWGEVDATVPAHDVEYTAQYRINQYTLTYLVDDAYYASHTYNYGTSITAIDAPEKEGYTFSGWKGVPATMPATDTTVTGTFKINSYIAQFFDGTTRVSRISVEYGAPITVPADRTKTGYTFNGWGEVPSAMPAHDMDFTAQFSINKYLLTYLLDGEVYKTDTITYGAAVTALDALEKEGHTFKGWTGVPATMPARNVEATGSFTINSYIAQFYDGTTRVSRISVPYGAPITLPADRTKAGYTFTGWGEVPTAMPAHDMDFSAQYSINRYQLTYLLDGEVYKTDSVTYGETVTPLDGLEKEGYTFRGWTGEPATMPAKDVEVTGTFKVNNYIAQFYDNGVVVSKKNIPFGAPITLPADRTKAGHTFLGWGDVPDAMPAHDMDFTAQYRINRYALAYVVDGEPYQTDSITYGAEITPLANPEKEGHTFRGWSTIPATMPAKDLTVTGTFKINNYIVQFVDDDVVVSKISVQYGASITVPKDRSKIGYTFTGWGDIPEGMPACDTVFYAQYDVNTYTLTYLIDGKVYKTYPVEYGAEITPEEETEDDLFYYGWESVPITMPAHDVEVNAYITGIAAAGYGNWSADANSPIKIYTIDGKRLHALQKGINIVRTPDGKTRKIIIR